jgi:hypothetical protein
MKVKSFALISVILFLAAVGIFYKYFFQSGELKDIASFEQCVAAGNATLETYPEQCRTASGQIFTENIGNEMEMSDKIRVSFPRPNQLLVNPATITGEARGGWFFEASAPVKLVDDESGEIVATGHIMAQGDWMTEKFVSFSGQLTFKTPPSPKATLILEKDNPSGDPAKAEQLTIPVYLK